MIRYIPYYRLQCILREWQETYVTTYKLSDMHKRHINKFFVYGKLCYLLKYLPSNILLLTGCVIKSAFDCLITTGDAFKLLSSLF